MPSIWIEASFVKLGDLLVVNGFGTSDIVNVANFAEFVWITNAEGDTYVYPASEIVHVVCEYDSPDYDYDDAEYDRREREWMEDDARYSEEHMLFLQVSHIEPSLLDGWFSG